MNFIGTPNETVSVQQGNFSLWRIDNTVQRKIFLEKLKISVRLAEFLTLSESRQVGEVAL
jgi:hypothetical protein